jgi:hypothetical protein
MEAGDWNDDKRPYAKMWMWSPEGEKIMRTEFYVRHSWKSQPCGHVDLSPEKLILDFWSPELQDNKFVLY